MHTLHVDVRAAERVKDSKSSYRSTQRSTQHPTHRSHGRSTVRQTMLAWAVGGALASAACVVAAQARVGAPVNAAPAAPAPATAGAPKAAPGAGTSTGSGSAAPMPLGGPMPSPAASPAQRPDLVTEAIEQTAPLTREEIVRLRREIAARSQGFVENVSGKPAPRPSAQVFQLDLSPRAVVAPPVVRVTPGQGAVVSFLDATGAPWPIELADNANADGGIVVQRFTRHQLSVFVRNNTALGNVLVALKDLPSAVSFTVVSGQDATDYQVHLVVPRLVNGLAPNLISSNSNIPMLGTADLLDYLLSTPPAAAKPLKVEGLPGASAWQTGPAKMVIRTEATLTEAMRHFQLDGTGVYEVRLSPLVVGTLHGKFVQIKVSGF